MTVSASKNHIDNSKNSYALTSNRGTFLVIYRYSRVNIGGILLLTLKLSAILVHIEGMAELILEVYYGRYWRPAMVDIGGIVKSILEAYYYQYQRHGSTHITGIAVLTLQAYKLFSLFLDRISNSESS
ncbi:hypothetical protein EV426DRAFT_577115 [Tirmania nivea]|nr:hypothetical protein EV426DRAFT_577115 [Tirmania nivea]